MYLKVLISRTDTILLPKFLIEKVEYKRKNQIIYVWILIDVGWLISLGDDLHTISLDSSSRALL